MTSLPRAWAYRGATTGVRRLAARLLRIRIGVVSATALVLFGSLTVAWGSQPLTIRQRQDIARSLSHSSVLAAPNGHGHLIWRCFTGRLSTVNPRYAAILLTNSKSCVARFGGATGEAPVIMRAGDLSHSWHSTGVAISDNCTRSVSIPTAVLRDLGCEAFVADAAYVHACRPPNSSAFGDIFITSVRNMTCAAAIREEQTLNGPGPLQRRTKHGFICNPVDRAQVHWRCVKGNRAYRWIFGG